MYGDSAASLRPNPAHLEDLDVVLFDIQDIGTRYYTYQATLGYLLEVAATTGTRVVVLDRPNPIDGVTVEGNVVRPGFESFVSAYPLAVRHGMTMGELAVYFRDILGIRANVEVVKCQGWDPTRRFDATGLPWVYPSPNMPTLDTAVLYPGMCLLEGTNLSEGRGTTRPFHLVGAPWFDAAELTRLCRRGAVDNGLEGAAFRAATFEPRFQKFAGTPCHGIEVTVTDADRLDSFLLGMVVLEAALRAAPDHFRWRTETYEFVDTPIAIDLLNGSAELRVGLESKVKPRDLVEGWKPELTAWEEKRAEVLLYER
ncbi:MAG: exo-beta-N-acetylmuramidase NamZ domain-containing protein [Myxococcota bacterium]